MFVWGYGINYFNLSWEEKIKDGINGIKISLDNLNDSITGLSHSVNKLTSQNDLILKELVKIDSTLKSETLFKQLRLIIHTKSRKEFKVKFYEYAFTKLTT